MFLERYWLLFIVVLMLLIEVLFGLRTIQDAGCILGITFCIPSMRITQLYLENKNNVDNATGAFLHPTSDMKIVIYTHIVFIFHKSDCIKPVSIFSSILFRKCDNKHVFNVSRPLL